MYHVGTRGRLLAGAALGLGLSFLAPQQARAACTVTPAATPIAGTVTCATTTTTDTTYAGVSPAVDRNYNVDTSTTASTDTVSSGATVDGFGLAFTNTVGGTNALNVVNSGAIQINAGNTASAGGNDALDITATGATPVNYSGTGTVTNLGTTGSALQINMTGTGNLVANIGGNLTSAVGGTNDTGDGLFVDHSGADGTVTVTTAAGTTTRADWVGLLITGGSTGAFSLTNNATVGSLTGSPNTLDLGVGVEQLGLGGITVVNNGAVGSAADRTQFIGAYGEILNAANSAALSFTGSGAIFSANEGMHATTAGTGTVTVNYTGAINTTGPTGARIATTTGAAAVTLGPVTAATDAVSVTSTTGAQTITLNGVTTGTAGSGVVSNTGGARTVTVGAGGNVTGGAQAILFSGTGTAGVTNGGIIGAASTGLAVNAAAAGATTVTNQAAGTINGRLTLSGAADTFTNSGTFNTQGTTDFGAGADTLNNTASGIINVTGATTLANLETFTNTGRINLNTFTLTGPAIAFNNAGFIDTNGSASLAGFTTLSNSGTLDLAAGTFTVPAAVFTNTGTILADEGATTITGQTSFANSGTIDLQDGAVGDVLTINSAFSGSGGSNLLIDFSPTAADRLVINGAASGSTTVNANFLGGGLINLGGVLVVDTVTAPASAFVLGTVSGVASPLVDFSLVQQGQDFFLVSAPNASAFNPLAIPALATSLWYQSADEVIAETRKPATTVGVSFWGDGYYSQDKFGRHETVVLSTVPFDVNNRLKTKRYGAQLGVDYGFGGGRVGLTGGYAWANADNSSNLGLRARGWNIGVYGQFGGITGFHGEFLAKHDQHRARFDQGAFDGQKFDIRENGIDGSAGYRFGIGGDANLDANLGLSYVRTKVDDIDAFGFNYDIKSMTSTRGRAGLRATFGANMAPYVDATVYHEFNGKGRVVLFDGANTFDLDTRGKGTWVRLEGGLSGNDGPGPILAAWADLGNKQGFGFRAGWRLGGAAEVAPPPPPPPPPPPATQTCPDGSVILATSVCPAPPPPPPPPPVERGERGR